MSLIDSQMVALQEASDIKGLTPKFARDMVRKFRSHLGKGKTELNISDFLEVLDDILGKTSSKEHQHHREALFSLFDSDHSGAINIHEFLTGIVVLGVEGNTVDKATLLFQALDKDNSGYLDKEDLKQALRMASADRHYVSHHGDKADAAKLEKAAWAALGPGAGLFADQFARRREEELLKAVDQLFAEADTEHDGRLSQAEWLAICQHSQAALEILRASGADEFAGDLDLDDELDSAQSQADYLRNSQLAGQRMEEQRIKVVAERRHQTDQTEWLLLGALGVALLASAVFVWHSRK